MKIKHILASSLLIVAAPFVLAGSSSSASTSAVAVVDIHALLDSSPQMQTMKTDLEKKFSTEHDQLVKQQSDLTEQSKKLDKEAPVMTALDLKTKRTELAKSQSDLQQKQTQFQQTVFKAQDDAMKKIIDKITTVVTEIAQKEHYDLVVPKNSTVYANKSYDLTETVRKTLDK